MLALDSQESQEGFQGASVLTVVGTTTIEGFSGIVKADHEESLGRGYGRVWNQLAIRGGDSG